MGRQRRVGLMVTHDYNNCEMMSRILTNGPALKPLLSSVPSSVGRAAAVGPVSVRVDPSLLHRCQQPAADGGGGDGLKGS